MLRPNTNTTATNTYVSQLASRNRMTIILHGTRTRRTVAQSGNGMRYGLGTMREKITEVMRNGVRTILEQRLPPDSKLLQTDRTSKI